MRDNRDTTRPEARRSPDTSPHTSRQGLPRRLLHKFTPPRLTGSFRCLWIHDDPASEGFAFLRPYEEPVLGENAKHARRSIRRIGLLVIASPHHKEKREDRAGG